ncbi:MULTISPECIES: flagellin [Bacillus]|uniref:flagellin N-terminal helical domain-containing protein n=1 Tax=Bacillus TaxID=1386 RepID=UPI00094C40D3|nr:MULTISPECIES: flagellin [Bacillus]MCU5429562.1 flagellin [Bacillus cereus]MCU5689290.1 flagellin [Bacillus cereus]MEC0901508.1 flagellin [Bacillus anthracis]
MRINTNINSMRTQEYMRQNQAKMSNAMDRLSSGKRINNASDDAAGLAIATRMKAREGGLNVASRNTQDGISLIRTADSALNSVSNILLRMRDLANQSATGTNTEKNQSALQKEFSALKDQIDYISKNTQFNDKALLSGEGDTQVGNITIKIQTLDSDDAGKQLDIKLGSATAKALGLDTLSIEGTSATGGTGGGTADVSAMNTAFDTFKNTFDAATDPADKNTAVDTLKAAWNTNKTNFDAATITDFDAALNDYATNPDKAAAYTAIKEGFAKLAAAPAAPGTPATGKPAALDAVKQIDKALESIATSRADLGATLNRLDFNVTNLKSQENSMAASASQIEDADMAKEMSEMTKFKILNEAGISMLSQANQTPQMVSKLLQ